jgi:hypothetical protein
MLYLLTYKVLMRTSMRVYKITSYSQPYLLLHQSNSKDDILLQSYKILPMLRHISNH